MQATNNKPLMGIKRATVGVLLTTGAIVLSSTSSAMADEVTHGDRLGPGSVTERWERASQHWNSLMESKAGDEAGRRWCDDTEVLGFVGDTIGWVSSSVGAVSYSRSYFCTVALRQFEHQTNTAIEEYRPIYEGALADLRKYNCGRP